MKKVMVLFVALVVFAVTIAAIKSEGSKDSRYVTHGIVEVENGPDFDLDWLYETGKEDNPDLRQVYYDKETGCIKWIFCDWLMVKD